MYQCHLIPCNHTYDSLLSAQRTWQPSKQPKAPCCIMSKNAENRSKEHWPFNIVLLVNGDAELQRFDELLQQLEHDGKEEGEVIMNYKAIRRSAIIEHLNANHDVIMKMQIVLMGSESPDETENTDDKTSMSQKLAVAFQHYIVQDRKLITQTSRPAQNWDSNQDRDHFSRTPELPRTFSYVLVDYPSDLTELLALLRQAQMSHDPNNLMSTNMFTFDGIISVVNNHAGLVGKGDDTSFDRVAGDESIQLDENNQSAGKRKNMVDACWEEVREQISEWDDFFLSEIALRLAASEIEYKPISLVKTEIEELLKTNVVDIEAYRAEKRVYSLHSVKQFDASRVFMDMEKLHHALPQSIFENTSIAVIVNAMVEVIVQADTNESLSLLKKISNGDIEHFVPYHETAAVDFLTLCGNLDPVSFLQEEENIPIWFNCIRKSENSLWPLCNFPGTGPDGRSYMPKVPIVASAERCASLHELKYLTGHTMECVRLEAWYLLIQDILKDEVGLPLRKRDHFESLDEFELPQRLRSVLQTAKRVISQYDRLSDSLLVAAFPENPVGKQHEEGWFAADQVQPVPSFTEWKEMQSSNDKYSKRPRIPLESRILHSITEYRVTLFSSKQVPIRLYRTPNSGPWFSVYHGSDYFGLRPSRRKSGVMEKSFLTRFFASCADGSLFTVQEALKSNTGVIKATFTTLSGIVISMSMDGIITQKMLSHSTEDVSRLIRPDGVVLATHRDGKQLLMYPNGSMYVKEVTSKRFSCTNGNECDTEKVDLETRSTVKTNKSGVVVVTYRDNTTTAYHLNGIIITFSPNASTLVIRQKPWQDVLINLKLGSLDSKVRHARESFPVRCAVGLSDHSSITLETNLSSDDKKPSITVVKSNGLVMSAQEDGHIRVYYTNEKSDVSSNRRDIDHDAFSFDCRQGQLLFEDYDRNTIRASLGPGHDSRSFNYEVVTVEEGNKQRPKPKLNSELPMKTLEALDPFLFVMHGDGAGIELLRPHDLKKLLADKSFNETEKGGTVNGSQLRTFIRVIQNYEDIDGLDLPTCCLRADFCSEVYSKTVATAVEQLPSLLMCSVTVPQFNIIRQIQKISWLKDEELQSFAVKLKEWRQHKDPKHQIIVLDPRNEKALEEEARLQEELIIVYKSAGTRSKEERRSETQSSSKLPVSAETNGIISDQGSGLDASVTDNLGKAFEAVRVDDLNELLREAFHAADSEQTGFLTLTQGRSALVHALGFGFSIKEIGSHLRQLGSQDLEKIAFDSFSHLTHSLQSGQLWEERSEIQVRKDKTIRVPAVVLTGMEQVRESNNISSASSHLSVNVPDPRHHEENASEEAQYPVGSALRAVWSRKELEE
uniref:AlNc14C6G870 protein n=1 Tax=Albugo laibachii Nc14 TaxID=890382 RepID=F0W1A1_9STRA|nr:AlNc14C6G870 [Albugo laibachii Nc14]|eukprot:CCA14828.1 AlNc14C6G870 [Albugo laibachii Nc14]